MSDPAYERLTAYLLGRLSGDEERRVEEDYLASDDRFLELRAAEDGLLDDFAAGRLSAEDHKRFEERLLPLPEMAERIAFARALALAARGPSNERSAMRVLPWLAAAALAVALGSGAVAGWRLRQARADLEAAKARESSLRAEVTRQGERAAALARGLSGAGTDIATWVLAAGRTRDGGRGPRSFDAPAEGWVRLRLPLERDVYPRYRLTLRTEDGESLLRLPAARTGSGAVEAMVPATSLPRGALDVVLLGDAGAHGWEESDVYPLHIAARRP